MNNRMLFVTANELRCPLLDADRMLCEKLSSRGFEFTFPEQSGEARGDLLYRPPGEFPPGSSTVGTIDAPVTPSAPPSVFVVSAGARDSGSLQTD